MGHHQTRESALAQSLMRLISLWMAGLLNVTPAVDKEMVACFLQGEGGLLGFGEWIPPFLLHCVDTICCSLLKFKPHIPHSVTILNIIIHSNKSGRNNVYLFVWDKWLFTQQSQVYALIGSWKCLLCNTVGVQPIWNNIIKPQTLLFVCISAHHNAASWQDGEPTRLSSKSRSLTV